MIFTGGHDIPNYNPDHGPTYDDAEPPVPEELKFITERWFDPMKVQTRAPIVLVVDK
jgi:hypothetical protein